MPWTAPLFDRLHSRYDRWYEENRTTAHNELAAVREALRGLPGPCVEVGVGTGWFASRLGCQLGVDPSMEMLRVAARRGVGVVRGRGEALPLATGAFGTVLLIVTLCFVEDPLLTLQEAARAARGGWVVACIVPRESPWGRLYVRLAGRGHPFYSSARFLSVGELLSLMGRAGLRVEGLTSTLTYPPWARPRREMPLRGYSGREGFVCARGRAMTGLERA